MVWQLTQHPFTPVGAVILPGLLMGACSLHARGVGHVGRGSKAGIESSGLGFGCVLIAKVRFLFIKTKLFGKKIRQTFKFNLC